MTYLMQLRDRIRRIRLPEKELARLAGIHKDTLAKTLSARCDTKNSTLDKIERALVAEERRVLAHLIALHPDLSSLPAGGPVTLPSPVINPVARNGHGAFSSQGPTEQGRAA
jgi:transcriptional regulator with XRE-family HTH domain